MSAAAALARIVSRDLERLAKEVSSYPSDAALWVMGGRIPNSGGTLALHLVGNLRHFIGAQLGADGYQRDRDHEFEARGLSRAELLAGIAAAGAVVQRVVPALGDGDLASPWPGRCPLGEGASVGEMLLHLSGHLMYHVGQINYHRRLLASE